MWPVIVVVLAGTGVLGKLHPVNRSLLESASLLAGQVAEIHFKGIGRPCLTVVAESGLMADFNAGSELSVLRITPTEEDTARCNTTLAGRLLESFYHNCFWWVIQMAKPVCFYEAWSEAHHASYPRQNPGFFFLPVAQRPGPDFDDFFLQDDMNLLVPKVLVANFEETDKWPVKLLTNDFYKSNGSLVYLDEWGPKDGFRHKTNLFPDKIKNLHGKGLRISAAPYPSYVILNITSDNLDGAEIRIMLLFCEFYNCTLSYVYDGNYWGEIYPENKTGIGELGMVYETKSDFGVAANYLWLPFFNYTDYSATYHEGALTVVVPKERQILAWTKPFKVFNLVMWASFVLCLMTSATTLHVATLLTMRILPDIGQIIKKKHQFTTPIDSIIRSLGMSVLQQPTVLVQGSPVRHIFTAFEFVYFILSSMYAAKLAADLTIPQFTKPIDTVQQLAEENLIWYTPDVVFVEGIRHSDLPYYKTIVKNGLERTYEEILELGKTGKYGMTLERMEGGYFTELPYLTGETISLMHVMEENYYSSPLVVVMQKGTPYGDKMNDLIGKMLNSGLFPYWVGDVTRRYQNYSIQLALQYASKVHADDTVEKLNVTHLAGAFILYAVGVLISFGFLFGEIISRRIKTVKTPAERRKRLGFNEFQ